MSYFNMEDPLVGGYSAEKVALRRAISLGFDAADYIKQVFKRNAVTAPHQSCPAPLVTTLCGTPACRNTTRRKRKHCWTRTATSIVMATAGATACGSPLVLEKARHLRSRPPTK